MSLNHPAVRETSVQSDVEHLLAEWLGTWFDGASHALGTNTAVVFPLVPVVFEGMKAPQPQAGGGAKASIEVSLFDISRWKRDEDWKFANIKEITLHGPMVFQIRAAQQGEGESRQIQRTVGDLLFALLNNPASRGALSEKGVQNLRPYMPRPIRTDERLSVLICMGDINFNVGHTVTG